MVGQGKSRDPARAIAGHGIKPWPLALQLIPN